MPRPIAKWDSERKQWMNLPTFLTPVPSVAFSETWPTAGMTRAGVAYRLRTWAHRTAGSGSSSLPILPTPSRVDGVGGAGNSGRDGAPNLRTVAELLPTPNASIAQDGEGFATWEARRQVALTKGYNGNGIGMPLTIAVQLIGES